MLFALTRFFRHRKEIENLGPVVQSIVILTMLLRRQLVKNEEGPIKTEGARVVTTLYIDFKTLKVRLLRGQFSDLAGIQTHPSFYDYPCYRQE